MDKPIRMHTKMHTNWEQHSASLAIAGFACGEHRVRIPLPPPHLDFITSHYIPKKLTNPVTDWQSFFIVL